MRGKGGEGGNFTNRNESSEESLKTSSGSKKKISKASKRKVKGLISLELSRERKINKRTH